MRKHKINLKILIIFLVFIAGGFSVNGQEAIVKGYVKDKETNEGIPFANVLIQGTTQGTLTDINGYYELQIDPGTYNFEASYIGYASAIAPEKEVTSVRPTQINFDMMESALELDEVVVKAEAFKVTQESPLSLRSIGVSEIRRNPGANRDISKVVQSLPGVTTSVGGYRNDLIIRGGAPNENRFYLDGVEVPNINHYATQGAGGGPAGLINVNFIREVDFYSGAFPSKYGNALSSVFDFKQRDGRDDRWGGSVVVSGTDAGISLEGPIGTNTTFLGSARRSYLNFIFSKIGLPFLPTYNDFQIKTKTKFDKNHELTFIGLGAIDEFKLNLEAGDSESSQFILENLPESPQWNYTTGAVYKYYHKHGFSQLIISRNMLNNRSFKYQNNNKESEENLILDYTSQEIENKLRVEDKRIYKGFTYNYGLSYEFVKFNVQSKRKIYQPQQGVINLDYSSDLSFHKFGIFGQISKSLLSERLDLSFGVRTDGNTYSKKMSNLANHISPRLSLSYALSKALSFNANTGIYYQLPAYTSLGYKENEVFVNEDLSFIKNWHLVAGLGYVSSQSSKITLEGYYKRYSDYPFILEDSITLANLGGDYGVVGNQALESRSSGRTYGIEFLYQQRLYKGFYGILAYTLGWSQFDDRNGELIASSWDARHIISATLGKQLRNNWEVGTAIRFQSGLPLTPFKEESDLVDSWDVNKRGLLDYALLNTNRGNYALGIDIRIDKKWFFKKWSLNTYIDIENVTAYSPGDPQLILDRPVDDSGKPIGGGIIVNPNAPPSEQRYKVKEIRAGSGAVIPSIGIQVDF